MPATNFEFRFRFLIIVAVFLAGFGCYAFDPVGIAALFAQPLLGHPARFGVAADRHTVQAILALGAGLAALGALVRTWAAAYLPSDVVHDPQMYAEGLVADGPFRYVRNPLYLGGILFAIGFAMAASRVGFVVIVGGLTLFFYRLIAREESLLSSTQGDSYRRYLAAVPRLIPSLRALLPPGGLAPRWGQAVAGEISMWVFAAAAVASAATLNRRLFLDMIMLGLAAAVVVRIAFQRKG